MTKRAALARRIGFVERAEKVKKDIEQIFLDAEYWNVHVRKLTEARIDPDPNGELKAILAGLTRFIGANRA
jgi:hypothetical protein